MRGYTNKKLEPTFNPKKHNSDRRIRRKGFEATKAIGYVEVKHKSNNGVEYIHYEPTIINI